MEHWKVAEAEIKNFRRYLSPEFPPLAITHGYDVMHLESDWGWGVKERRWRQSGVYLVYDDAGTLLYVGKATATFNKRVKRQAGLERASSVALIPFPDGFGFMAHALEAFLIARLTPPGNKCGINDYVHRW